MGMFGVDEFLPSSGFMEFIGQALCRDGAITQGLCGNVLFLLCGFDSSQLNEVKLFELTKGIFFTSDFFKTALPVIISHSPAGASSKTILHYTQEINSGINSGEKDEFYY